MKIHKKSIFIKIAQNISVDDDVENFSTDKPYTEVPQEEIYQSEMPEGEGLLRGKLIDGYTYKSDPGFLENWKELLKHEGGVADESKAEKGLIDTPTAYGVQVNRFKEFLKDKGIDLNKKEILAKDISPEDAAEVAYNNYYKANRLNEIKDPGTRFMLLDSIFHGWRPYMLNALNTAVKSTDMIDPETGKKYEKPFWIGNIGDATLNYLNSLKGDSLKTLRNKLMEGKYNYIKNKSEAGKDPVFRTGIFNRLKNIQEKFAPESAPLEEWWG